MAIPKTLKLALAAASRWAHHWEVREKKHDSSSPYDWKLAEPDVKLQAYIHSISRKEQYR